MDEIAVEDGHVIGGDDCSVDACDVDSSIVFFGRQSSQALQLRSSIHARRAADDGVVLVGIIQGIVEPVEVYRVSGLHDSTAEELVIASAIGCELEAHGSSSRALAEDGDFLWVALLMSVQKDESSSTKLTAECFDVVLDPLQGQSLITQTKVHLSRLLDLLTPGQEPPGAEAVVDGHSHDRLTDLDRVLNREGSVVAFVQTASHVVTATVDPESNGELLVLTSGRTHNIDVEAVLRDWVAPLVTSISIALEVISKPSFQCATNIPLTALEYCVAGFAPLQLSFKATGFRNLRLPTGGCAYGIPRKKSWSYSGE